MTPERFPLCRAIAVVACAALLAPAFNAVLFAPRVAHAQQNNQAAAFIMPGDANTRQFAIEVEHLADEVLLRQPNLAVVDVERLLGESVVQENEGRIVYGKKALEEGKGAYEALDLDNAQAKFAEAIQYYEQSMAYLPGDGSYEESLLYMGAAAILSGDAETAKLYFRRILTLQPDMTPDSSVFPPMVSEAFEETRNEMNNLPMSTLKVTSDPPAAEVYVNGVYRGVTPIDVPNLIAGEHFVVFERKGYHRASARALILAGREGKVEGKLQPTRNFNVFNQLTARCQGEVAARQFGTGGRELGRWLNVQYLLLGSVTFAGNTVNVTGGLFDLSKTNQEMRAWDQRAFDAMSPNLKTDLDAFFQTLFEKAASAESAAAAAAMGAQQAEADQFMAAQAEKNKKITDNWWFWPAVGAGAAVVIAGGVIAYLMLSKETPPEPSDTGVLVLTF